MIDYPQQPSKPRRLLRYACVFGVALLVLSVTGTSWIMRTPAADKASTANNPPVGSVICFGYGYVNGGLRQLYPMLIQPNTVKEVKVKENDIVAEGAVLLEMDDEFARTNLQKADADLKNAEVLFSASKRAEAKHNLEIKGQELAISDAQERLVIARRRLDRVKDARERRLGAGEDDVDAVEMVVKGLETTEKAEKIKLDALKLLDPKEDITRAEQCVKEKQAVRDQAEYALKQCRLTAPVAGTVVQLNVNPGDLLGPQPRQPAILFCPSTPRIIRAEIEQEFAARVTVGDIATIQDDTTGQNGWKGKVTRLSDVYTSRRSIVTDVPFQLNDVRTLECIIELDTDPSSQPVKINQRMRVTLTKQ